MRTGFGLGTIGLAAAGVLAALTAPVAPAAAQEDAGERLGATIEQRLRAEGPFFMAEERAVIERACGYAPGSWDGFEISFDDGVLVCTNGRRADGPEVRAVLAAAEPRIEARVARVMASPEVSAAIARVAGEAGAEAARAVELAMAGLDEGDIGSGEELDVDVDVDIDPDIDVDIDIDRDADADRDRDADADTDADTDADDDRDGDDEA